MSTHARFLSMSARFGFIPAAALGAACMMAVPAVAQVSDLQPYYALITQDGAKLWAGDADIYYSITELKAGQVVRVDGKSDAYLRVAYPKGTSAFVGPEEGRPTADGSKLKLTRDSNLRAMDPTNLTPSGCWKSVFYEALPVGTELKITKRITSSAGQLEGYLVEPPDTARAYVFASQLRQATQAEADAHLATLANANAAPENPTKPRIASEELPDAGDEEAPAIAQDPAGDAGTVAATQDREPGVETPAVPTDGITAEIPAGEEVEAASATPIEAEDKLIADLDSLERSWGKVMEQPILEAEYEPMIEQYEKLRAGANTGTPSDASIADIADMRIESLKIQQKIQTMKRDIADLRAKAMATTQAARDVAARETIRHADYLVVGRLVPSAVYSGDRLPQLYRVISVGSVSGRTLAYLMPDETLGLEGKAGSVVGVVGERPGSGPAQVGVVDAKRVDVLEAGAPVGAGPAPAAPEPEPAPAPIPETASE